MFAHENIGGGGIDGLLGLYQHTQCRAIHVGYFSVPSAFLMFSIYYVCTSVLAIYVIWIVTVYLCACGSGLAFRACS